MTVVWEVVVLVVTGLRNISDSGDRESSGEFSVKLGKKILLDFHQS